MRKFETHVQLIKYKVLKEVAKHAMEGTLMDEIFNIPKKIIPGPDPVTRCCVYKERAIIQERIKLATGGDKNNNNIIEVIDIACDECPINRFTVTEACRGCLAHRCSEVCPVGAIFHEGQRAHIDQDKCIECGKCKEVCSYNAIADVMRPCRKACNANALSIDRNKKAVIDNEKCIQCGACVYQCPFGAIMDKSFIVDVVNLLKEAKENKDIHVYAIVAPAISSQFTDVKIRQVITGIRKLGFHDVVEVALGADIVSLHEAKEFTESVTEKGVVTSSCCPAFVSYIEKNYPGLKDNISNTVSPMIAISRLIKHLDEKAKIVFIGPCTAKKMEIQREELKDDTDFVITFEELTALLDAAGIKLEECEEGVLNNASFFGRIFARSGGVSEAIKHVIEEEKLDVEFKPISCDGISECDKALKIARVNKLKGNFIEGMACKGGCIGGAASLNHGPKDKKEVDKYGKLAIETTVRDSLRVFDLDEINLDKKPRKDNN
ncbi:4Fe-4S dicluster domain-containing protein [Thermohalobacter berrensis]|uniref:Ferredoxin n=1 Tax=Thermohalobacter berrensis TaxID=99594 RepID=A0A419T3E4_9FIRM|nr:4Fe-4S dicluster domain-containing protein [Thermohalobacter berrensis]RKD32077.1 ferredoxin [Thermohalobacter berrensis]